MDPLLLGLGGFAAFMLLKNRRKGGSSGGAGSETSVNIEADRFSFRLPDHTRFVERTEVGLPPLETQVVDVGQRAAMVIAWPGGAEVVFGKIGTQDKPNVRNVQVLSKFRGKDVAPKRFKAHEVEYGDTLEVPYDNMLVVYEPGVT